MNKQTLSDREIMDDILSSQKYLTDTYNLYAGESANSKLRTDFLNILREEHNISHAVFDQMVTRGWYCPPSAELQRINAAHTKFSNIQQSL